MTSHMFRGGAVRKAAGEAVRRGACLLTLCAVLSVGMIGCAQEGNAETEAEAETIRCGGSSTMMPMVETIVRAYTLHNPSANIDLSTSGSGEGVQELLRGQLDVARVSRALKADELEAASQQYLVLRNYLIGYDAVAVIVHPSRADAIKGLTGAQLRAIFSTGELSDWSAIDPNNPGQVQAYAISPVKSGTGQFFFSATGIDAKGYHRKVKLLDYSPIPIEAVANNPNGIGFVPFVLLDDRVRAVAIGGKAGEFVACETATIRDASYPLTRPLQLVTVSPSPDAIIRFLDFALSESGQALIASTGAVPIH